MSADIKQAHAALVAPDAQLRDGMPVTICYQGADVAPTPGFVVYPVSCRDGTMFGKGPTLLAAFESFLADSATEVK
jgi:hypothetical protein